VEPQAGRIFKGRAAIAAESWNVTVIGSGSWGCAFGRLLWQRGHRVQVLTLTAEEAVELNRTHRNPHFLPGVELPSQLEFVAIGDADLGEAGLVAYAIPTQAVRAVARWVAPRRRPDSLQLSLAKGLELGTLQRPSEIIAQETGAPAAALSGPNHAEEVARDMPSATVIASHDEESACVLQGLITCETFRVYTNPDVVGVEFCGAAKNPVAMAVGMSDGLGYGDNTRASLITRSVAELARLGAELGAHVATFTGLAGIGDVIATCTSRHSRNRLAGELLAAGESPTEVEAKVGQVVEGIPTTYALHDLGRKLRVDMPVSENVYEVLEHGRRPADCVRSLMGREPTREYRER
jgi:glycerol-3-phosphate dehydrogenase (NAD(P)+)